MAPSTQTPNPAQQIWIRNFEESLRQLQIYIVSGIVASASYFLIGMRWGSAGGQADASVQGTYFGLDAESGLFVAWLVYYFFGVSANRALYCATRAVKALADSHEVVDALFGNPSLALAQPSSSFLMCGPAFLVAAGIVFLRDKVPGPHPLLGSKLFMLFTVSPYVIATLMVWNLFIAKNLPKKRVVR